MADAAAARRRADRRRRHEGRRARQGRRDVHHDRRHRPSRCRAWLSIRARVRPGDRVLVSGSHRRSRHHDSAGARRAGARGGSASDTRSVLPLVEALVDAAGPGSGGCAIRPAAAWRRRSTSWRATAGWPSISSRSAIPVRDAVRGACELLGLDPAAHRQRRTVPGGRGARAGGRGARGAAARARRRRRARDRRGARAAGRAPCSCDHALWRHAASSTCWSAIRCPASAEAMPMTGAR